MVNIPPTSSRYITAAAAASVNKIFSGHQPPSTAPSAVYGTDAANPSHSHGTGNLKGDTGGAGQIGSGTLSQRHTHTMNYSLSGFAPGANSAIVALGSGPGSGTWIPSQLTPASSTT